ncbi:hypothetical protein R8510_04738 [Ralstonia chuxiongensis]|nr:hypothetical protein R8510_04738 [Ralstonia chuxiongensis]
MQWVGASPLSLGAAVDIALCNNLQIKAAWAQIKLQASQLGQAKAAYLPSLSLAVNKLRTTTHYPDAPDYMEADSTVEGYTAYASLNWRIFDFGGRTANKHAADAMLSAAFAQRDASIQKTLHTVVGAFFDALAADHALAARQQATKLAQDTYESTLRRERKGVVARNDSLQAATALAKAQLAQQRASGEKTKALTALSYALGLAPQTALRLQQDGYSAEASHTMDDLSSWLRAAQAQHPAIVAAKLQWTAAQEKVVVARSEGRPTLELTGSYAKNGYPNQGLQANRTQTTTIGLTLNIPLFEGFARTYKVQEAQAQAQQSLLQMQDVEHQTLGEVVKAYADAQAALLNLTASQTLLQAAQQIVSSSRKRYLDGAADILELLSSLNALTEAQQERIHCIAEWNSARLRLWASAGNLSKNELTEMKSPNTNKSAGEN